MQRRSYSLALAICAATAFSGLAFADFVEDFSGGLGLWTTEGLLTAGGDVNASGGVAVLGDLTDYYSALYLGIALDPGTYVLEFDVQDGLSADLNGNFPDTLYASLYFINNLTDFSLAGLVFDDAAPLFNMDGSMPGSFFDVFVDLSPSGLGADWTHITYAFTNSYQYVIPTFELFDLNFATGDSVAGIDNVTITAVPVPEPATVLLLGCGIACLTLSGRKRSS